MTRLPFVNADLLAADRWPDAQEAHAYEASALAAEVRERLIRDRTSFITETVFSHPSKLDLIETAKEAGYLVELHVVIAPVELSVARSQLRVRQGGHSVPEGKIRKRYVRLWPLVAQALPMAQIGHIWDASSGSFLEIARFRLGRRTQLAPWPKWAPSELRDLG